MTASRGVLGSATFLVAVSGLLDPPLIPPNGLSPLRRSTSAPPPNLFRSDARRGSVFAAPLASMARRRKRYLEAGNGSPGRGGEGVNEAAAGGRRHGSGHGMFDADAWKNMSSSPPPVTAPPTSLNPPAVQLSANDATAVNNNSKHQHPLDDEGEEGREESVKVDVEKLPTFVFFVRDNGRLRREEVIGGRDARTCAAELREKLASTSSPGSTWAESSSHDDIDSPLAPSRPGEGGAGAGVGRISSDDAAVVGGPATVRDRLDDVDDTSMGSGSGGTDASVDGTGSPTNIVEISDKRDLLRVLGARGQGQGPVVVMYHAPWCRKCAYLTPVFRRLAAAQATSVGVREAGGSISNRVSSEGPLFCRVDVSHPSFGRRRALRGASAAPSTVASEGTAVAAAAAAAAATAVAGRAQNTVAIADGASSQARGLGVGDRAAGLMAADANAATTELEGAIAETELLHAGSQALENCDVCGGSGFVPCGECGGRGAVSRSSPDGKHTMAVTCPSCVGYKRLRCPSCGGKCYMCD
ncbi:unnamed protein product [Ectocarpus fasciculatus]